MLYSEDPFYTHTLGELSNVAGSSMQICIPKTSGMNELLWNFYDKVLFWLAMRWPKTRSILSLWYGKSSTEQKAEFLDWHIERNGFLYELFVTEDLIATRSWWHATDQKKKRSCGKKKKKSQARNSQFLWIEVSSWILRWNQDCNHRRQQIAVINEGRVGCKYLRRNQRF